MGRYFWSGDSPDRDLNEIAYVRKMHELSAELKAKALIQN